MASIKEVAQKAGVGVGTVSRVINGSGYVAADTRKKIEQAISDLEYTPNELARNLFRNRTGIIGVLIPDLDHPFFSSFARETEVALYKRGYKAMICNTVGSSNRERDYLNMVDGIITSALQCHHGSPGCLCNPDDHYVYLHAEILCRRYCIFWYQRLKFYLDQKSETMMSGSFVTMQKTSWDTIF